jgi:hypothetical protein
MLEIAPSSQRFPGLQIDEHRSSRSRHRPAASAAAAAAQLDRELQDDVRDMPGS